MAPGAGLDSRGKFHLHRDSIPGPSSPYRIDIPTRLSHRDILYQTLSDNIAKLVLYFKDVVGFRGSVVNTFLLCLTSAGFQEAHTFSTAQCHYMHISVPNFTPVEKNM